MANPDDKLLPILEFDELVALFEYVNPRAARKAITKGTFPVPTFVLAGRTVAHVDVVDAFFESKKREGFKWLVDKYADPQS